MPKKALALFSGGLDSALALVATQRAGAEVVPVQFTFPFSRQAGHEQARARAQRLVAALGFSLRVIPLGEEFMEIVRQPRFGRGKHLNPCIDCRLLMVRAAAKQMPAVGADFLVTGEVLGQRPMSQHRQALARIDRASGLAGLIVRPLSAHLLEPTIPEERGWIDRTRLFGFSGRTRTAQMQRAQAWGITDYETPAGGCLLTDKGYAQRAKDLLASGLLSEATAGLIQFGRYFNLSGGAKLILARHEKECLALERLRRPGDWLLKPEEAVAGPTAVLLGPEAQGALGLAAGILAGYCKTGAGVRVEIQGPGGVRELLAADPLDEQAMRAWMLM